MGGNSFDEIKGSDLKINAGAFKRAGNYSMEIETVNSPTYKKIKVYFQVKTHTRHCSDSLVP